MNLTLARTLACTVDSCRVQLLDDDSVIDAPLAPLMIQIGTRIRPEMIVALDRSATPPEIRWRFETRPVEALTGDRITLHGRQFQFTDARRRYGGRPLGRRDRYPGNLRHRRERAAAPSRTPGSRLPTDRGGVPGADNRVSCSDDTQ